MRTVHENNREAITNTPSRPMTFVHPTSAHTVGSTATELTRPPFDGTSLWRMYALASEWINLLVRWIHIIAGIMWIGSSIFFHWLDRSLSKPESAKAGVEGELWMVHSGGFYQVEKKLVAPEELPKTLHWFKWEAAFTWLSGFFLLILVYHLGGGILLVDPSVANTPPALAHTIALGALVAGWAVYHAIWKSPLAKQEGLAAAICAALAIATAFGLSKVLSGRAAYLHLGAMLGTIMVANVWMVIIPAQRALVEAVRAGQKPDPEKAKAAKRRSSHNHYMTYPVVFIMISHHFPSTYGASASWAVLAGLMILGFGVKYWMNVAHPTPRALFATLGVLAIAAIASAVIPEGEETPEPAASVAEASAPKKDLSPIDPASTGTIRGVVRFEGEVPKPEPIRLPGECQHPGPAFAIPVRAEKGLLAEVFVSISEGLDRWQIPPPPKDPVTVDQKACFFEPRMIGVRVGQPVRFLNSDPMLHNVRALGTVNRGFSLAMPLPGMEHVKTFNKPEVMVPLRCDVHPWMTANIGVKPHPYFAVTNASGEYVLSSVPPGEYVIEAWHETLGRQTAKVSLGASGTASADFTFKASGEGTK
jgi:uncharacterized membrane protein